MKQTARSYGFTLIEVLIALAIAATALALGMQAIGGGARRLARIEEAMATRWAIDNAVAEVSLQAATIDAGRHVFTDAPLGRALTVLVDVARDPLLPIVLLELTVEASDRPGVALDSDRRELVYARP
jgi:type II secretion system protein I